MEILVLWVLILRTLAAFWRVRPLAGALLIPYLAWVTFAAALTCSVWQRNPGLLAQPAAGTDPTPASRPCYEPAFANRHETDIINAGCPLEFKKG